MDFIFSSASKKLTQQHIKAMHLKQIYLAVLRVGELSRAQLKDIMELSFPSVSALVDELISAGILMETDSTEKPERGRPRTMLAINGGVFAVPVVKLTRAGYVYHLYNSRAELTNSGMLAFSPDTVPGDGEFWYPDTEMLTKPICDWLAQLDGRYRLCDLVFCIAGNVNSDGHLTSSALSINTECGFAEKLTVSVGRRVVFMNDSDCAAYAEKLYSDISGDFVYILVGKGVGAGIVRGGRIFGEGMDIHAGEIGHISIDCNGRFCECGSRGCLERYVSTDVITSDAAQLLGCNSFSAVAAEYLRGNTGIVSLIDEKARMLAFGIANMLTSQPVENIVLGGGIEALGERFLDSVRTHLKSAGLRRFSERVTLSYTKNPDGDNLTGAIWNYLEHRMKIETLL